MNKIYLACLLSISLFQSALAVVDPNAVQWNAQSNQAFVESAYMAVYGTVPSTATVTKNTARIHNRLDRLRFAKWLLTLPTYSQAFGSPRGDYDVRYRYVKIPHQEPYQEFAVMKDFHHEFTTIQESDWAQRPALLLMGFYSNAGEKLATPNGSGTVPSGDRSQTVNMAGRVYQIYRHYAPKEVWDTLTLTSRKANAKAYYFEGNLKGSRHEGTYLLSDGALVIYTVGRLRLQIDPDKRDQTVDVYFANSGASAPVRFVRVK